MCSEKPEVSGGGDGEGVAAVSLDLVIGSDEEADEGRTGNRPLLKSGRGRSTCGKGVSEPT